MTGDRRPELAAHVAQFVVNLMILGLLIVMAVLLHQIREQMTMISIYHQNLRVMMAANGCHVPNLPEESADVPGIQPHSP